MLASGSHPCSRFLSIHDKALPFVLATSTGCEWKRPLYTNAYRYCRRSSSRSLFITHLRWSGANGEKEEEMSRIGIIDVWMSVANLYMRASALQLRFINTTPFGEDSKPLDETLRLQYEPLHDFLVAISIPLYRLSSFLRVLGDIELSETVHEEWPNEPEDYPETIAHVIDTTSPSHTWPFQCIRILQRVLADTSTLEARLRHLEDTYQIFLPMIVRPEYGEWKGEVLQASPAPLATEEFSSLTTAAGYLRSLSRSLFGSRWEPTDCPLYPYLGLNTQAVPFVMTDSKGCDWGHPRETVTYRYCRKPASGSIFITHLKQADQLGGTQEISRIEAVDAWTRVANLYISIDAYLTMIRQGHAVGAEGRPLDIRLHRQYDTLQDFFLSIQEVLYQLSNFYHELGRIESSGTVRDDWPRPYLHEGLPHLLRGIIDPEEPINNWPYQYIRFLQKATADCSSVEKVLEELNGVYNLALPVVKRPGYGNWKGEVPATTPPQTDPETFSMATIAGGFIRSFFRRHSAPQRTRYSSPLYHYLGLHTEAAVGFVATETGGCDWDKPHEMVTYRYCRKPASGSLFITHLKQPGSAQEMSRIEAIEIWLKTTNLYIRTQTYLEKLREGQPLGPEGRPLDTQLHRQYDILLKLVLQTMTVHYEVSSFFESLEDIESSGKAREADPKRDDYPSRARELSRFINTLLPTATWPYQCIRWLQEATADISAVETVLGELEEVYHLTLPVIKRPEYANWNGELPGKRFWEDTRGKHKDSVLGSPLPVTKSTLPVLIRNVLQEPPETPQPREPESPTGSTPLLVPDSGSPPEYDWVHMKRGAV